MTTETTVQNLKINKLTKAQYDTITPSDTELYMVTDGVISSSDVTTALGYTPENVANKVTAITSSSTDTQYPSAKLLYDKLALKYDATNPNGYQANVIETVKVNGTALIPSSKAVDITVPAAVTESTVSGWGFTKNAGTITGITMNGSSKGTSGVVDLGTVITAHQDISGKVDKTSIVSTVSSSSTNSQVVGAKLFYDTVGDIESALNAINSGSNS